MTNYVYKEGSTWYAVYANPENPQLSDLFGPWEKKFPTKKAAEDFLASLVYPTTETTKTPKTKVKKVLTEEQRAKKAARAKARREARKAQAQAQANV